MTDTGIYNSNNTGGTGSSKGHDNSHDQGHRTWNITYSVNTRIGDPARSRMGGPCLEKPEFN